MKKKLINEECDYPENNSLYIMLLSGNLVTYGDENRTKQRHLSTNQIYKGVLDNIKSDKKDFYSYDITNMLKEFKDLYPEIIEQSNFTSYDNIVFIHMCSSRGITQANAAKSRAQSYSSGVGGFSSGGAGVGSSV